MNIRCKEINLPTLLCVSPCRRVAGRSYRTRMSFSTASHPLMWAPLRLPALSESGHLSAGFDVHASAERAWGEQGLQVYIDPQGRMLPQMGVVLQRGPAWKNKGERVPESVSWAT